MKLRMLITMIVWTVVTLSCKKKTVDDGVVKEPEKVKLLTRIITTQKDPVTGTYKTTFTTLEYNDKHLLIAYKEPTAQTIYFYDDLDRVYLFIRNFSNVPSRSETNLTYENGKVRYLTTKSYLNNVQQNEFTFGLVYAAGTNNVVEIDRNNGALREVTYTINYTGNIPVKKIADSPSSPLEQDFTYDDKKSIYANSNAGFVLRLPDGPFPVNNYLTQLTTYTGGSKMSSLLSSVFTYDTEGYPKTEVRTATSSVTKVALETRITYEYTEF